MNSLEPLALEALVTTADGVCVYANQAAREARGELAMGRRCVELGLPAAVHDEIALVLAERRSRTRALGDELASVTVCVAPAAPDRALVLVLDGTTENGVTGAREGGELAARLCTAASLDEVMEITCHQGLEALGADEGFLLVEAVSPGDVPPTCSRGMPEALERALQTVREDGPGALRDALALGTPYFVPSRRAYARDLSVPAGFWPGSHESRAFAALPLCGAAHRVVGTWIVVYRREQRFTEGPRERVAEVRAMLGPALERALHYERARAEEARARQAELAKDAFLSTVAHELGTPLSTVLGWASLLKARPHEPELLAKGLDAIVRNAKAQAKMVDDLLSASRLASGRLALSARRCDANEEVRVAVLEIASTAELRQVVVSLAPSPSPPLVFADPERLRRVLGNLLDNAVKFSETGGTIEVAVTLADATVSIRITDHGRGMERTQLLHLFDPEAQPDRSTTRRTRGLGLGLAVARQLIELHGGTLRAESEGIGQGTTLTVTLPAERT